MDQDTGENNEVVASTEDVPTSESQEQLVDQQEVQQQVAPETETGTNEQVGEIPKDNATWAKMRVENKRLREVVENIDPQYLESLRSAVAPQMYSEQQVPQVSGDAEYTQVIQGVNTANNQAARAMQELARVRTQLELQQDREAERAFPELKSDKVFQQIVAEKKLAARVLGHDRTTYEIADEVSRLLGKRDEQVAVRASEETQKQILQKQVISSEPKGQSSQGRSTVSSDELRDRVRHGDTNATEEMAKGIIADLEF